ncbi:MAG: hypothetical protein HRT72_13270 [Flavobacteriales bacterium]|nr:hypothetical protein [Flavobacteriales bacterium]
MRNLTNKIGFKWTLACCAIIMSLISSCEDCDKGKAQILVAVYRINGLDSILVKQADVYLKCGATTSPGTEPAQYGHHDTTDYTGKVLFKDLSRNDYFFYATAEIPNDIVDVYNGDTNWTLMNTADLALFNRMYEKDPAWGSEADTARSAQDSVDILAMDTYLNHIYKTTTITGHNTMAITNKQGETTLGVVLSQ